MKALTVYQPWASAILAGMKRYDRRSWVPPMEVVGQRIAIHASAKWSSEIARMCGDVMGGLWRRTEGGCARVEDPAAPRIDDMPPNLPLGAVLGTVWLRRVLQIQELPCGPAAPPRDVVLVSELPLRNGEVEGLSIGMIERHRPGEFLWEMDHIHRFQKPYPARGKQRLWDWSLGGRL